MDFSFRIGTKREAELDDVSPSKLKALKASNGTNGEAPTVVDDDSSNHKNGDYHDEEDEDDDVSYRRTKKSFFWKKNLFYFSRLSGSCWRSRSWRFDEEDGSEDDYDEEDDGENGEDDEGN